jgi:hypothetical protein
LCGQLSWLEQRTSSLGRARRESTHSPRTIYSSPTSAHTRAAVACDGQGVLTRVSRRSRGIRLKEGVGAQEELAPRWFDSSSCTHFSKLRTPLLQPRPKSALPLPLRSFLQSGRSKQSVVVPGLAYGDEGRRHDHIRQPACPPPPPRTSPRCESRSGTQPQQGNAAEAIFSARRP